MSDDLPARLEPLPLDLARRVNDVCRHFEAAWQTMGASARPRVEDYLAEAPEPERSALLRELIPLEADYRRLAGEDPQPEEYQRRFPVLDPAWLRRVVAEPPATGPEPPAIGELADAELPSTSQTQPIRCPHCHHPIAGLEAQPETVLCPGCGSSFRVRDVRPAAASQGARRLGKFQLLERVGAGAFGTVWKAHDTELDRVVALKIPHASLLASPDDLERFYREARAAAQLHHPGIVTVHEVTALEGLPVIVADFVEGVPLRKLLNARPLTFRESATLVAEVAEAVDYAHALGLVHRDLKPANIMVEDARPGTSTGGVGQPRVMDFGLALRHEAEVTLTLEGQIIGTPAYMSPEQAAGKGHQVDRRSDGYSLGVILYELLCDELPFRGSTTMLLQQVLHEEPQAPRRLNGKIPRDLETICLKAMAKEPGRRFASARALAEDLRRWLNGEPIQARPVGRVEALWRWSRRNPKVAGLTASVATLLVAVAVGATLAAVREQRLRTAAEQAEHRAVDEVVRMHVTNGMRLVDEGDLFGALPSLAQALTLEQHDPAREEMHRYRLAAVLQHCPKLVHLWAHEDKVVHAEFDADGRCVVTASDDGTARVWDVDTGQCRAILRHHQAVRHAAFSPEGRHVVTASADGTACIWDAVTGQAVTGLLKHAQEVKYAVFSPDSRWVVTASADQTARLWNAASGQERHIWKHSYPVYQAAFSPDSSLVVTISMELPNKANRSEAILWDAATGQRLRILRHGDGGGHVAVYAAFSPNGRRLVTAGHDTRAVLTGRAQIWDVATGAQLATIFQPRNAIHQAAFSPDGGFLVTAHKVEPIARLWDATTGQLLPLPPLKHGLEVKHVAFSPEGRRVLTASADGTARVWDVHTGQPLSPTLRHGGPIVRATFHPDGRRVVTASEDGSARLWDLATGVRRTPPLLHLPRNSIMHAAFSPDGGRVLSVTNSGYVRVWDAATSEPITPWLCLSPATSSHAAFSPDGSQMVTGSGNLDTVPPTGWTFAARVWHAATGQPLTPPLEHAKDVNHVAYSPDGRQIVTASGAWYQRSDRDGEARVWDAATGQLRLTLMHEGPVRQAEFSPNGRRIVTASADRTAGVWEAGTGQRLRILSHGARVHQARFSPDGRRVVTASGDGLACIWDADTGRQLHAFKHGGEVRVAAFSGDGRRVLTAGPHGQVWDAATGQPCTPPLRHAAEVFRAAFSPDGRQVVTASLDRTARVWDAATGQPLTPFLEHLGNVIYTAFSPDGRRLLTASNDSQAQVWELPGDEHPLGELVLLAQLLSGHRIDETGSLVPVSPEALQRAWQKLVSNHPEHFAASAAAIAAWHRHQADLCSWQSQWAEVVHQCDRVLETGSACAQDWYARGNAYAELDQWDKAAADFRRAIALRPAEANWWFQYGLVSLVVGDLSEARRVCAHLLEHYGQTDNPGLFEFVLPLCHLTPDAVADPSRLVSLAEQARASQSLGGIFPRVQDPLGPILYRAGQFDAAMASLRQTATRPGWEPNIINCRSWLYLAMAHQRLGQAQEAKKWLQQAIDWIENDRRAKSVAQGDHFVQAPWGNLARVLALRREAEALIYGPAADPKR